MFKSAETLLCGFHALSDEETQVRSIAEMLCMKIGVGGVSKMGGHIKIPAASESQDVHPHPPSPLKIPFGQK